MNNRNTPVVFLLLLSVIILASPCEVTAKNEDTAHLKFEKTAILKKDENTYVVKKGDWIANIIRKQLGTDSYADIYKVINEIKQLNPDLKNLDNIHGGQKIIIPGITKEEIKIKISPHVIVYKAKRGDSIIRILNEELKIKDSDTQKTLNLIKHLNPNIKNLNIIRPGQVLQLPALGYSSGVTGNDQLNISAQSERQEVGGKTDVLVNDAKNLAVLKHVLSNIKGTLITSGSYYIPLPQTGQITIDCGKIPVVEFDDGSTILIDFSNGMPDRLRQIIQTSWKNYKIINYSKQDDIISILQKVIKSSKSYDMIKAVKPLVVANKPQIQLNADWIISKKTPPGNPQYIQIVSLVKDVSQLLPRHIVNYAERNGLIVTEIADKNGILKSPQPNEISSNITNLNASTNKDLVSALLVTLGYTPVKEADVKIYNQIKDGGFNLTITVDYLVKKENKDFIITSNILPKQFMDILKEEGSEVILFNNEEKPVLLIEKLLSTMNFPHSYNTFSFPIPDKGLPRATINYTAFRITNNREEPVFLIDFDMDNEIYSFIQSVWRLKIVKY